MKTLKAHFNGSVLVPDESVDLPIDRPLSLRVEILEKMPEAEADLGKLADLAQSVPKRDAKRTDRAAQHDHYLYGTPKRS